MCDSFLAKIRDAGLHFEEIESPSAWKGTMKVSGLSEDDLKVRKEACRFWIGRWIP